VIFTSLLSKFEAARPRPPAPPLRRTGPPALARSPVCRFSGPARPRAAPPPPAMHAAAPARPGPARNRAAPPSPALRAPAPRIPPAAPPTPSLASPCACAKAPLSLPTPALAGPIKASGQVTHPGNKALYKIICVWPGPTRVATAAMGSGPGRTGPRRRRRRSSSRPQRSRPAPATRGTLNNSLQNCKGLPSSSSM
jgi:hypothetical protein